MKRFENEGNFDVVIKDAFLAEPRFNDDQDAVDVAILVQTKDDQYADHWCGELSQRYGIGAVADKMQWELTLSTLKKLGWEHGADISDETLKDLIGTETTVKVVEGKEKDDGSHFYNVKYIGGGGGGGPKRISPDETKAKVAAIFRKGSSSKVQKKDAPPEPPQENDDFDPFA